ncbi:MAG TPA: class I SAM-dependent methyltransferase [Leptospiraceae bacterium]|nr:class I SAM-dependent methyltransferase [Leptospiraceae bacterium]
MRGAVIEAIEVSADRLRKAYDRRSGIYAATVAKAEWPNHLKTMEKIRIEPSDRILEVAVGPGFSLVELLKRSGGENNVFGVDMSAGMLDLARKRVSAAGFSNVDLRQADAGNLPFEENKFDILYNAYMLDLIPLKGFLPILTEFKRVLKPGGKLVLLNMSKETEEETSFREKIYQFMPKMLSLYLMGGCRPVLMSDTVRKAGFRNIEREFLKGNMPSEIVLAVK